MRIQEAQKHTEPVPDPEHRCSASLLILFLDNLTFDKLLSKFDASLIKFDVAYPYGDKHEEFAKVRIKH
jgi:hypothetical protein